MNDTSEASLGVRRRGDPLSSMGVGRWLLVVSDLWLVIIDQLFAVDGWSLVTGG